MNKDSLSIENNYSPLSIGGSSYNLLNFKNLSINMFMLSKNEFLPISKSTICNLSIILVKGNPIIIHLFTSDKYKKVLLNEHDNEINIPKNTYFAISRRIHKGNSITTIITKASFKLTNLITPKQSEMLSLFPEHSNIVSKLSSD